MRHIVIRHCPFCPTIRSHVRGVAAALEDELNTEPRLVEGVAGEFTVLVGDRPVYRKSGDVLPTPQQVVAAANQEVLAHR